ncbi:hypothetical protein OG920_21815 [Streptomyces europaeiscabiei]|uniref:hypothetical protein n=1 Tax=Streptomyces TaxID=1883 RepID=UPI00211ADABA|nr:MULTISPECIES: hypothetical protein [Streptomyces]MDX3588269.1 hypothetical protein [Streptomyces europaeiscabiei]MDX3613050.1 hypothetical protein [Streptomyces europaeiscabiei]MDX3636598.1 hypothetical protein [Streptomyces europaeiscabiei]MDX3654683.1 hypothetical protein [Streptomyces europaeiscabiei]
MAFLEDLFMSSRPAWLVGCVLAQALLLTSCTSDDNSASDPTASPTTTRRSTELETEKKLTAEVQSALDAVTDQGGSMIESGVERVSDGAHTRPGLAKDGTYKVAVVCAGKGDTEIVFTPTTAGPKKLVHCDGTVVFQRFAAQDSLRLDIQGQPGATGMIAWRINEV